MDEFKARWDKDWIGAEHLTSGRLYGFNIEQVSDGHVKLEGGAVAGWDGLNPSQADIDLERIAREFAIAEVEKTGKTVSS